MTMTSTAERKPVAASGFADRAAAQHLYALWLRTTLHQTRAPSPAAPTHLRWTDLSALVDDAIRATDTQASERRVMLLGNPAFRDPAADPHATPAFHAGIQTLMPGESARPHRHTPNALRFMMEDGGDTYTVVDGKPCRMERGDVVLTPAYTWHGHYNRGRSRSVWLDVLDSQLNGYLDAGFFEPHADDTVMPATVPDAVFVEPGYAPVLPDGVASTYSPRFRFPWTSTVAALDAAPVLPDGSAAVRLANPASDGAAMPPMDCRMVRLTREATRGHRTTAGAVCVVARGSGVTELGDHRLQWRENDVFTLPQWTWTRHRAQSDDAVLFVVSEREIHRRLDVLREEHA